MSEAESPDEPRPGARRRRASRPAGPGDSRRDSSDQRGRKRQDGQNSQRGQNRQGDQNPQRGQNSQGEQGDQPSRGSRKQQGSQQQPQSGDGPARQGRRRRRGGRGRRRGRGQGRNPETQRQLTESDSTSSGQSTRTVRSGDGTAGTTRTSASGTAPTGPTDTENKSGAKGGPTPGKKPGSKSHSKSGGRPGSGARSGSKTGGKQGGRGTGSSQNRSGAGNNAARKPAGNAKGSRHSHGGQRLRTVLETSAGGLVVRGLTQAAVTEEADLSRLEVALIGRLDRRGRMLWSMPKGHIEPGETVEETARREVLEETGVDGTVLAPLGTIDYWFVAEGRRIHKTVHHHLIRYDHGDLCDEDPEITEVAWVPFEDLPRRLAYPDERKLVEAARTLLPQYVHSEVAGENPGPLPAQTVDPARRSQDRDGVSRTSSSQTAAPEESGS